MPDTYLFVAVLVYSTAVEGGYTPVRFSEDVVPIRARTSDEARTIAERVGLDGQTCYPNEFGETVRWSFLGVADLQMAQGDDLEPGVSLYSRSFDDLDQYRRLYAPWEGER
ncbi:DUF4288 domain-containing protein [Nonomuraea sp. NPDC050783]|uniref:DUF4288 domain-containing protein n=1 Tax=Nonomuraea sp. NPDC050783 TaxID=3154634 RepID=UPI00346658D1